MSWLLLVLLEQISGLIQDAAVLWDEEVSVPLMNLELLQIREEIGSITQKNLQQQGAERIEGN